MIIIIYACRHSVSLSPFAPIPRRVERRSGCRNALNTSRAGGRRENLRRFVAHRLRGAARAKDLNARISDERPTKESRYGWYFAVQPTYQHLG
ncbi:hypothetical protein ZHAS_00017701 [Anopheles sinensis]|uniref:Uncharacterized protein n=1 Tax=Anopheles sinensis TaxID=74873 RepID=A0A084WH05_ANOSI|nr:hypothetical protein ZHAS_00017701 [Anopheles sinensis]